MQKDRGMHRVVVDVLAEEATFYVSPIQNKHIWRIMRELFIFSIIECFMHYRMFHHWTMAYQYGKVDTVLIISNQNWLNVFRGLMATPVCPVSPSVQSVGPVSRPVNQAVRWSLAICHLSTQWGGFYLWLVSISLQF